LWSGEKGETFRGASYFRGLGREGGGGPRRTSSERETVRRRRRYGVRATFDAVEEAVEALGRDPGLVLIFPTGDLNPQETALQAHAAAGEARVAGMTGTGVITPSGAIESGCSAIAFDASVPVGIGTAISADPRAAGRTAAAEALVDVDQGRHVALLLFVDSESGDQAEIVDGAYEIAGGRIPLAGGAAGGETRAQFADGRPLSGNVVAVAIASRQPIGVGISHGCVPRGTPSIVTRSHGRVLLQLDGRPAEAVYLEKIGVGDLPLSDDDFEAIAMAHPLAQPELRGDVRPRYVRGRMPGGGLVCATSIEANAAVDVCEQKPEAIVRSAVDAVDEVPSALPRQFCFRLCCKERAVRQSTRRARGRVDYLVSGGSSARNRRYLHTRRDRPDPGCERRPQL
jgi:hypothetical protein